MYSQLIYTGQVSFRYRLSATWESLKIAWAALNGWVVSGLSSSCIKCHIEPVMERPGARICSICFAEGMAEFLNDGSEEGEQIARWLLEPVEEWRNAKAALVKV